MYDKIKKCRICNNTNLIPVLDLGTQMLTGVFPKSKDETISKGPLRLVKCYGEKNCCGLLQLEHSYNLDEMYGVNYGYRSGLNHSMVRHLRSKIEKIEKTINFEKDDIVIDIGSNDATTLKAYHSQNLTKVGIDPTGIKFEKYYPENIILIAEFFSAKSFAEKFGNKKVKVITSFSMFYDLQNPLEFMSEIYQILDNDGIWVFEQSYMPTMLKMNSYDTVCHEHIEYYCLKQIKWMTDKVGFDIVDIEFNSINGGSFSITVKKKLNRNNSNNPLVDKVLLEEQQFGLNSLKPYIEFEKRAAKSKDDLIAFIGFCKNERKKVAALGASTKGNVILQYCNLTNNELFCAGEVNPDKFGSYTPGTWIPIVSEDDMIERSPDYMLVLPWHFKRYFIGNSKFKNMKLVFPLPSLEVI